MDTFMHLFYEYIWPLQSIHGHKMSSYGIPRVMQNKHGNFFIHVCYIVKLNPQDETYFTCQANNEMLCLLSTAYGIQSISRL